MAAPRTTFEAYCPEHEFLVAIDSDGCVFDTMELKHKECFIPNIINEWDLQAISRFAREVSEFVNLYSKWRGINRFPALVLTFDLLRQRREVQKRGAQVPEVPNLRAWIERETKLGNPALERAVRETGHSDLERALRWSRAVNETVARFVRGVPPFPFVRQSLERLAEVADIIVVSGTPTEALLREWNEHGIACFPKVIAGQEAGSKAEMLGAVRQHYGPGRALMIGDAPGDQKAAAANDVAFYPIVPGEEDDSWQRFFEEALTRFLEGAYGGAYESELVEAFHRRLPESPPWLESEPVA